MFDFAPLFPNERPDGALIELLTVPVLVSQNYIESLTVLVARYLEGTNNRRVDETMTKRELSTLPTEPGTAI